jgi:acyl-CoA reductase-like NAD-dependent aldehyde dehydrogenase
MGIDMKETALQKTIRAQRDYFNSGATRDITFRKEQLRMLEKAIRSHEEEIMLALEKDLKKPRFESYAAEIGILYPEIREAARKVRSWARPKKVSTSILHFYSRSTVYHVPYGVTLIIGPWNYPFQLTLAPLIAAIAAGNCAVLKPSELAPATSAVIASIIGRYFNPAFVTVIEGGVRETQALLSEKFDYIFFTGGTSVGKIIMDAAAKHLTPVTLELGGKSPVILHSDARLDYAVRRIAWGKFFNAGQTCLATDYLLVHRDIRDEAVRKLKETILAFYGSDPKKSPDYARIITARHFERVSALMKDGEIIHGGDTSAGEKFIAPTLIDHVTLEDRIMKEEIFGPLLPIIEYGNIDEAIGIINGMPRPLALYLFTESRAIEKKVLGSTLSGGGCVNDTISHVGNTELPFGGIGDSGMGSYHGKTGFDTFTHRRSILKRGTFFDLPLRYPPYGKRLKLVQRLFSLIR